jgi:hypothetical protein
MEEKWMGSVEKSIRMYHFSHGYVSVPKDDVMLDGGGFLPGFPFNERYFAFHSLDPLNQEKKVLYRDATPG